MEAASDGPKRRVRCMVMSRVVGYYAQVRDFNKGKVQEFKDRKEYDVPQEVKRG